jgi:chromosome segregation ATPase
VILGMQDLVDFTTKIQDRDDRIASLERKLLRVTDRAHALEDEKMALLDDLAAVTAQADVSEARCSDLAEQVATVEAKNTRMARVLPANILSTVGVYLELQRGKRECEGIREENGRLLAVEAEYSQTVEELQRVQSDCGALYCSNQELERLLQAQRDEDEARASRLEQLNEELEREMGEQHSKTGEIIDELKQQIDWLKQKYFFSHALALKMGLQVAGDSESATLLDVNELWGTAKSLPTQAWDSFLAKSVASYR